MLLFSYLTADGLLSALKENRPMHSRGENESALTTVLILVNSLTYSDFPDEDLQWFARHLIDMPHRRPVFIASSIDELVLLAVEYNIVKVGS